MGEVAVVAGNDVAADEEVEGGRRNNGCDETWFEEIGSHADALVGVESGVQLSNNLETWEQGRETRVNLYHISLAVLLSLKLFSSSMAIFFSTEQK